ncbi:hypothetical protein F2Q70_00042603 [Brassica cretica]|uniref:Uncharacterized protein n=1 Tax=Brassica cretica TaxID=69181 RepID=A0A8S9KFJ4_BRACR|nr:hypothetical protein F2Q70_00042603 [Brassica cretica]
MVSVTPPPRCLTLGSVGCLTLDSVQLSVREGRKLGGLCKLFLTNPIFKNCSSGKPISIGLSSRYHCGVQPLNAKISEAKRYFSAFAFCLLLHLESHSELTSSSSHRATGVFLVVINLSPFAGAIAAVSSLRSRRQGSRIVSRGRRSEQGTSSPINRLELSKVELQAGVEGVGSSGLSSLSARFDQFGLGGHCLGRSELDRAPRIGGSAFFRSRALQLSTQTWPISAKFQDWSLHFVLLQLRPQNFHLVKFNP